ncbi:hypothetical protein ICC18_00235 [Paenibacillus sp. WST5]|uniref:Uncharacterized protein n=1 Tax=Paenibacillus sedimenti TaxID=2770274 RepID=A0A926KLM2_9BACL|nr:hypothetical protein [Paenibacillus sedimenti]
MEEVLENPAIRLVAAAVYADELINQGAIGRVVNVIGLGPHKLNPATRPDWYFGVNSTAVFYVTLAVIKLRSCFTIPKQMMRML